MNLWSWFSIAAAVALASLSDSVSALWAQGENKFSIYFFLLLLLGPLMFISFGLVTSKVGLAIASGVVNSLIVVTSILVGLFFFGEWSKISPSQYVGMVLAIVGTVLMLGLLKK